jgi:hypothetical protein
VYKYLQNNRKISFQIIPQAVSVPPHRTVSDDSWPTVLGIVPVSRLPYKRLQKAENNSNLCSSDHHKHTIFCSSQFLK